MVRLIIALSPVIHVMAVGGGWAKARIERRRNNTRAWVTALLEAGWEWDGDADV